MAAISPLPLRRDGKTIDSSILEDVRAGRLEGLGARELLIWAIKNFHPRLALSCSFGNVEGLVLLRNEGAALPLRHDARVALIGPNAAATRIMGGGSSSLGPLPHQSISAALTERRLGVAADKARLEAPIPRPARNVFCLGRNYKEHAAERGAEAPPHPVYFTKAPETVVAPGAKVIHHAATKELDSEVELAVVIGKEGKDIPREEALSYVFGYTIVNDVTARDLQKRHQQWFHGKSLDTFCPMGPVLVTADEIPDPQALSVAMRINGETRQSSHTSKMIFPVDECIAVLSQGFTIRPGDVIATGTPEGVGAALGKFLKAGDRMEAEVERIGILANRIAKP